MPSSTPSIQPPPCAAVATAAATSPAFGTSSKLRFERYNHLHFHEQADDSVDRLFRTPCRRRHSGRSNASNQSAMSLERRSLQHSRTSASPSGSPSPRLENNLPGSENTSERRRQPVCAQTLTRKLNAISEWQCTQSYESSRGRERLCADFLESYRVDLSRSRSPSPRVSGGPSRDEMDYEKSPIKLPLRAVHRVHLSQHQYHHHHNRRCRSADPGPEDTRTERSQHCITSTREVASLVDGFYDPSDWDRVNSLLQLQSESIPALERRPRPRRVNPALLEDLYNSPSTLHQHHGNANIRHT